jgi:spore coat protein H
MPQSKHSPVVSATTADGQVPGKDRLQCESAAGTIAQQPFQSSPILTRSAGRSVKGTAAVLPGHTFTGFVAPAIEAKRPLRKRAPRKDGIISTMIGFRSFILLFVIPLVLTAPIAAPVLPLSGGGGNGISSPPAGYNSAADFFFGLKNIWTLHLRIEPSDWSTLESSDLRLTFSPPHRDSWESRSRGTTQTQDSPDESPLDRIFDYVPATLEWQGQSMFRVGVRYKGNSSYWTARDSLKRPFKLDFNRFVPKQQFFGLKKLNLSNNILDPSQVRQSLAADIFRRAGIPAPRTAFIRLYLTVPGQLDRRYLGLYTAVEQVDDTFIRAWMGNAPGFLMKPEFTRGLSYLGEEWPLYREMFVPKSEPSPKDAGRMIDFVRLLDLAPEQTFQREVDEFIEESSFLRFLAVQSAIANLDSPLMQGKNSFLSLHPRVGKLIFFPWDFDLSFGRYPTAGSMLKQSQLAVFHPFEGRGNWLDRYLAIPGKKERLRQQYDALMAGPFSRDRILSDIDAMYAVIHDAVADDPTLSIDEVKRHIGVKAESTADNLHAEDTSSKLGYGTLSLRNFIERRSDSITRQLRDQERGYVPEAEEITKPDSDRPESIFAWQVMRLADGNRDGTVFWDEFAAFLKRCFDKWDYDHSETLSRDEVATGFLALMPPMGPRTGTEQSLVKNTFWREDVPTDHRFSREGWERAGRQLFESWDTGESGFLNRHQIDHAIVPGS